MNRVLGHGLTCLLAAGAAFLLTPGCADNDVSIYIQHVIAPPENRQNNRCTYEPDPTLTFISEGVVDVLARDTYVAPMLVGSHLRERGDPVNTRAESNKARINGVVVTVTDANGAALGEFTAAASSFLEASGNDTAAYSVLIATIIDAPTMNRIGGNIGLGQTRLVLANVKAFGQTLGGVDLETGEFQFPIRVCRGCLVTFAFGDDPATQGVDCRLPLPTTGGNTVVIPCSAGQDEVTPCQLCSSRPGCQTL